MYIDTSKKFFIVTLFSPHHSVKDRWSQHQNQSRLVRVLELFWHVIRCNAVTELSHQTSKVAHSNRKRWRIKSRVGSAPAKYFPWGWWRCSSRQRNILLGTALGYFWNYCYWIKIRKTVVELLNVYKYIMYISTLTFFILLQ